MVLALADKAHVVVGLVRVVGRANPVAMKGGNSLHLVSCQRLRLDWAIEILGLQVQGSDKPCYIPSPCLPERGGFLMLPNKTSARRISPLEMTQNLL
jgi:hypothetical protein